VKVSITRGGGLAGVPIRTELTSEALPEDAAQTLEQHVKAVVPVEPSPLRRPDEMLYTVCVEHDEGTTEAQYTDSTLPEDVRSLIAWADQRPERSEEIRRPGA
jgi:hypothetical protein